jgi:hypothetical protein
VLPVLRQPTVPGQPPPVMVYFQTLLHHGELNEDETVSLMEELLPLDQGEQMAALRSTDNNAPLN